METYYFVLGVAVLSLCAWIVIKVVVDLARARK
jgi:hypothetical protein